MTATRIDFKHVRAEADFSAVLAHYGIDLTKDGTKPGQFKALCPFHDDTRPSLKINTDRNLFHCFACGAKGNVIEFVMEHDGIELRAAAEKVAALSGIAPAPGADVQRKTSASTSFSPPPDKPETPEAEAEATDAPLNQPLGFELKLTHSPELLQWLETRGLMGDHIELFGLGLVSKKSRSIGGRLAIPLHNETGQLIGYCGRHVGNDVPEDTPKYVLPKRFHKDLVVFNLHRAAPSQEDTRPLVVLFESYFSVMRHSAKLAAVSPMGRSISSEQVALLVSAGFTRALVVFDGDSPGRAGARDVAGALAPHLWTRVVDLPDGVKPHHLSWDELRPLLTSAWDAPAP